MPVRVRGRGGGDGRLLRSVTTVRLGGRVVGWVDGCVWVGGNVDYLSCVSQLLLLAGGQAGCVCAVRPASQTDRRTDRARERGKEDLPNAMWVTAYGLPCLYVSVCVCAYGWCLSLKFAHRVVRSLVCSLARSLVTHSLTYGTDRQTDRQTENGEKERADDLPTSIHISIYVCLYVCAYGLSNSLTGLYTSHTSHITHSHRIASLIHSFIQSTY